MPNLRQIISAVFLSCKIPRIVAGATPADLLCPQNTVARLLDKTHTYLYETRHLHDGRRDFRLSEKADWFVAESKQLDGIRTKIG